LYDDIETNLQDSKEQLLSRIWWINYSLFVFFNNPDIDSIKEFADIVFNNENLINAIELIVP